MFSVFSMMFLGRVYQGILILLFIALCNILYVVARKTEWTYPTNRCIVSAFICTTISDILLSIIEFGNTNSNTQYTVTSLIAEMTLIGSIFLDALLLRNIVTRKRYRTVKTVIISLILIIEIIFEYNHYFAQSLGFKIGIPGISGSLFYIILTVALLLLIYASGYFSLKSVDSSRIKTSTAIIIAVVVTVLMILFFAFTFNPA